MAYFRRGQLNTAGPGRIYTLAGSHTTDRSFEWLTWGAPIYAPCSDKILFFARISVKLFISSVNCCVTTAGGLLASD